MLPKWFFPATRLTKELRKAGYEVDVERAFFDETIYTIFEDDKSVGTYYADGVFGFYLGRIDSPEAKKMAEKYA